MNIEKVESKGQIFALIFRHSLKINDEVKFLTPEEYPLQLGLIDRKQGYKFRPHIHNDFHYKVNTTQEFLYIEEGILKTTIFDNEWFPIYETALCKGDFLLTIAGGHAFEVKEDVRIIEVKQGPYPGDKYAKRFKD